MLSDTVEAVDVNCDATASTPMMWPTELLGAKDDGDDSGESCANYQGCFQKNTDEFHHCINRGDGTVYSWTEYGAYYCPVLFGTGECLDADARASDGAFDVLLLDDDGLQDSNRFFWDNGGPDGQERQTENSTQVEVVYVHDFSTNGHTGAFGGWFK